MKEARSIVDGPSPQDLVEELDRLEAQEDAEDRDLNSGILPGGSRDLDEVMRSDLSTAVFLF